MKLWIAIVLFALCPTAALAGQPPNVLVILVDDLKPVLGCYGDKLAKTEGIDRLARRGIRFDMAYCNQAVCAPSRFNLMLGSLSTSSGLYGLVDHLRRKHPDAVTLPQYFKKHGGHTTISIGKVFHVGHGNKGDDASFDHVHKDKVVEYLLPESREGDISKEEVFFEFEHLTREEEKAYLNGKTIGRGAAIEAAEVYELYDLIDEPIEQRNRANEHPDIVAELRAKLDDYPQPRVRKQ